MFRHPGPLFDTHRFGGRWARGEQISKYFIVQNKKNFSFQVLNSDQIKSATVESLRFMNNKIKIIDNDMFG